MPVCPCGQEQEYGLCCGLYHSGNAKPLTAQALMRLRYAAFVKAEIAYLKETTWPANQKNFDETGYTERARNSLWLGLVIHSTEAGGESDAKGTVTFTAKSMMNGKIHEQTEKSLFKKKNGHWYYVKPLA